MIRRHSLVLPKVGDTVKSLDGKVYGVLVSCHESWHGENMRTVRAIRRPNGQILCYSGTVVIAE